MSTETLQQYEKAQEVNIEKLALADRIENPTVQEKHQREKIQGQFDTVEKAINRLQS